MFAGNFLLQDVGRHHTTPPNGSGCRTNSGRRFRRTGEEWKRQDDKGRTGAKRPTHTGKGNGEHKTEGRQRVSYRRVEGKMIATVSNVLWGDTSI